MQVPLLYTYSSLVWPFASSSTVHRYMSYACITGARYSVWSVLDFSFMDYDMSCF